MVDGVGNPEGGSQIKEFSRAESTRIVEVQQRDQRAARLTEKRMRRGSEKPRVTEVMLAEREARHMDKTMTRLIERAARDGDELSINEAKDLVNQLPEFNLTGEPRLFVDDVHDAIERNSFKEARDILDQMDEQPELDREDIRNGVKNLLREHVRTIVEEGDTKHFLASVSFLGSHLREEDFPKDKLQGVATMKALKEHAISIFEDNYRDPHEAHRQLEGFYALGLLKGKDVVEMPEILRSVGSNLVTDFEERNSDFVNIWPEYQKWLFGPKSQTFKQLHDIAVKRTERMFTQLEDDPRKPLVRLSIYMDLGLVSEKDVKGKTLAGVRKVLSSLDSYEGSDPADLAEKEAMEQGLADIRAKFGEKK